MTDIYTEWDMFDDLSIHIDKTVCTKLFSYKSPQHFGPTEVGRDILTFNDAKKLCWYGIYDMGYTLLVNLNEFKKGVKFDAIKLCVEFGNIKYNIIDEENLDMTNDIEFIDFNCVAKYMLHFTFYKQIVKNNDYSELNLSEIGEFHDTFENCFKSI